MDSIDRNLSIVGESTRRFKRGEKVSLSDWARADSRLREDRRREARRFAAEKKRREREATKRRKVEAIAKAEGKVAGKTSIGGLSDCEGNRVEVEHEQGYRCWLHEDEVVLVDGEVFRNELWSQEDDLLRAAEELGIDLSGVKAEWSA